MTIKRVLITKLASMGDLVHILPALSDAKKAIPDIVFDFVVDKSFQEVPLWHSSVCKTFITNHRQWRTSLLSAKTRKEWKTVLEQMQKTPYDLIIDAQGNLKSCFLSLFAKGPLAGWDGRSVPEWGSHFFYQKKIAASKKLHAIERLRLLFSGALNYPLFNTKPEYNICQEKLQATPLPFSTPYFLFVPIASTAEKLWKEEFWQELIARTKHPILIPWGNEEEKKRADRLAVQDHVRVLPKLNLSSMAYVIQKAKGVVSLDTGLSHIAAALNVQAITLYGPTDPLLTGTIGENQIWIREPHLWQITPDRVLSKLAQWTL